MSTHPNVILMAALTPDNLARATYRAILAEHAIAEGEDCPELNIEGESFSIRVMEDSYDKSNQISAKEGDIVLWDLVTYGYGEAITWDKLQERVASLLEWCRVTCAKHHCSYEIRIGANYW